MSDTPHAAPPPSGALGHYVDKWLAAQPPQRIALVFVPPARYPGQVALAALEQELLDAAYGIREPQVAAAKLNWWAEELAGAPRSGGRHPLTQALFADPRAVHIGEPRWLAPIRSAVAQLDQGTATDFAAQLTAASELHDALAALETAWWYGDAPPLRAGRLATLGHLLHALRRLEDDAERDRLPLPMAHLARHGLSRADLRKPGPARTAAIKAQLADLQAAWREAAGLPGPLTVFRTLESRQGERLANRALRAATPLSVLQAGPADRGLGVTLAAWGAARRWRKALV